MKSWLIFRHSFRQVTNNLGSAARVSLVPFILAVLVVFAVVISAGGLSRARADIGMAPGGVFLIIFGLMFYLALTITIAVNWHRYVLLNEPVTWWPSFHGARILQYFGRSLLIGIVFGIGMAIAMGVSGAVVSTGSFGRMVGMVLMFATVVASMSIFWRLSAALPGAAIGGSSLGDAWNKTRGTWGTMLMLTLIYVGFALLTGIVGAILTYMGAKIGIFLILKFIWEVVVGWFTMMLVLSILTTLYGHYVEKRALV
ncbi:hypothetical protein [Thioclava sp.]|uniref:hypothetical protein n=1 Tax=Thioclava sp. TaxID=1933450 RepID=UPI003AA95960